MIITNYTEVPTFTRGGLDIKQYNLIKNESAQFKEGYRSFYKGSNFVANAERSLLYHWSEVDGFQLTDDKGTLLWELKARIAYALALPNRQLLWLVRRDNEEAITVLLYNYEGTLLAELSMKDELYSSTFLLTALPEEEGIAIDFGGGQDGSQDYLLVYKDGKITKKKLPADAYFITTFCKHNKALLLNYYEQQLLLTAYPSLKIEKTISFPEDEWQISTVQVLGDSLLLLSDTGVGRHYLYDLNREQLQEEIVLQGYEPTAAEGDDLLESPIMSVYYEEGRFIFHYYDYIDRQVVQRYFVSEEIAIRG